MKATTGHIWDQIATGDFTGPEGKPMLRVTVDHLWNINSYSSAVGDYPSNRLPIRWWVSTSSSWKNEIEIPTIKSVDCDWSTDQDAATAQISIYNTDMTPLSVGGLVGDPGHMSPDRGESGNRWGHSANSWADVIVPGALIRTYQGYGGYNANGTMKSLATCLSGGYVVQSGTWVIDDVRITTDGMINLNCRDMMFLVIDQPCFPPLVPDGDYPFVRSRYAKRNIDTPRVNYGPNAAETKLITGGDVGWAFTDATGQTYYGYWLVGDDSGVFTYGANHFYGSNPDIGTPTHTTIGLATNSDGIGQSTFPGYWVAKKNGTIQAFGGAPSLGNASPPGTEYIDISSPLNLNGLYLCTTTGEVENLNTTHYGGEPTTPYNICAMATRPDGDGYWLMNTHGQVYCQPVGTMVRVSIGDSNQHGTYGYYVKGCRCSDCKMAQSDYQKNYRRGVRLGTKGPHPVVHTEVPIESLSVGDKVVSYDVATRRFHKEGHVVTRTERRPYDGMMVRVTTEDGQSSSYTPDHHCVVMVDKAYEDKQVVYLMRRGNQYRIGRCQWRWQSQKNICGPLRRCKDEGGDAFWVLSSHDTKEEAALAAALVGYEFGIPTWEFKSKGTRKKDAYRHHLMILDEFWGKVGDNTLRAIDCLKSHQLKVEYPLWDKTTTPWFFRIPLVVAACNLSSGMAVLPITNAKEYGQTLWGQSGSYRPVVVTKEWYKGDIVSISVEEHHTYIADGIVTHNSYGDADYFGNSPDNTGFLAVDIQGTVEGDGYWITNVNGQVYAFGGATHHGDIITSGITLQTGMSAMIVARDGSGYWLIGEDGGVFAYGPQFYGSLVGESHLELAIEGNYDDWTDIVKDFLLYSGFWVHNEVDGDDMPAVYGSIEPTSSWSPDEIGPHIFDKQSVIDCITKIKEVVGYLFLVRSDGSVMFASPNWWGPGNFLYDGSHTDFIPEIDEQYDLLGYGLQRSQRADRSLIIISTDNPMDVDDPYNTSIITTKYIVPSNGYYRGVVRPTLLFNLINTTSLDQEIMAELISLHIIFQRRLGSATCIANPMIEIDDQVKLFEQQSEEMWCHYVRGISTHQDLDDGTYTMSLTTHFLGDEDNWAIEIPDGFDPVP